MSFLLQVCAYNRTVEKVDHFLANEAKGTKIIGARSLAEMTSKLKKPRRVMMLVKAGQAVDDFIGQLVKLLLYPFSVIFQVLCHVDAFFKLPFKCTIKLKVIFNSLLGIKLSVHIKYVAILNWKLHKFVITLI